MDILGIIWGLVSNLIYDYLNCFFFFFVISTFCICFGFPRFLFVFHVCVFFLGWGFRL
jgi:hypothetical protein